MEKWREVGIVTEGQPIYIGGVNVWDYKWILIPEADRVKLPHPSYLNELHDFSVYDIEVNFDEFKAVRFRFAASELSYGVWGFYVPHY